MKRLFDCYSRILIDSHITDCRPEYMRQFSPREYVRMVKLGNMESSMVYACCHNGNCYYPTKVGHMHTGLKGRDVFGETVNLLRENDILPIAYYTATYHNDCVKRFPETAIVPNFTVKDDGRYLFSCPNQDTAVEFYREQIREILDYDIAGIFIDMSFWPTICCCDKCRERFGSEFPELIDWHDQRWVKFQRFRERSMAEFAMKLTDTVRKYKPGISVTHQFSPVLHGWRLGQSTGIAEASDYASGDFYGNKLQQRFAVKAFAAFSTAQPFEFMTSRCVNLTDHTSTKSSDELFLSALTTLANGGAYFFIDAIDPSGRLREKFYQNLSQINRKLESFKNAVASEHFQLHAETGLYFSISCCVDNALNGKKMSEFDGRGNNMETIRNPVRDEVMGAADVLIKKHVPFKVITGREDFNCCKVIIINSAAYMPEAECEKLRDFVRNGGTLIATGATSLCDFEGNSSGNFQLADVFGVDFTGRYTDKITYIGEDHVLADGISPLVSAGKNTRVIDYLNLPDFPYHHQTDYASIHSDPPSENMSCYPGLTVHEFGKGRCFYLALPVFALRHHTQQEYCKNLLNNIMPELVTASCNLPSSAEITLLDGDDPAKHLLCIVNYQDELPPVPLHNVSITLDLPYRVYSIQRISDGRKMDFEQIDGKYVLNIPEIVFGEFYMINENKGEEGNE